MQPTRSLIRVLGAALVLAGALALPTRGSAMDYPNLTRIDGFLTANGDCVLLRQHDGRMYSLRGDLDGLRSGDHVRLEGRFAPDPGCGASGFEVNTIQALWADENHEHTYYDHRNGEPFRQYAARIGRFDDHAAGDDRGAYDQEHRDSDRGGANRERRDADRDRDPQYPERADRGGRYVYEGPHRQVTLVGKLHEAAGACPTLNTSRTVFALDGDLREYQAGDMVQISGVLYEGDPNAPCGGPTVVIHDIRGHGRR